MSLSFNCFFKEYMLFYQINLYFLDEMLVLRKILKALSLKNKEVI
ncbi:hypothetical Protein psc1_01640 [Candidatus Phytoplasma solani]